MGMVAPALPFARKLKRVPHGGTMVSASDTPTSNSQHIDASRIFSMRIVRIKAMPPDRVYRRSFIRPRVAISDSCPRTGPAGRFALSVARRTRFDKRPAGDQSERHLHGAVRDNGRFGSLWCLGQKQERETEE